MTPPLRVIVGNLDLTEEIQGVTFSASDPGGFETASLKPTRSADIIRPGQDVRIYHGLDFAWHGRVAEPHRSQENGKTQVDIGCVGYSASLKDRKNFQMIYVDRDLKEWGPASRARQVFLLGLSFTPHDPSILTDTNDGLPCLALEFSGAWVQGQLAQAVYDAGQGNEISYIIGTPVSLAVVSAGDANWSWQIGLGTTDTLLSTVSTANPTLGSSVTVTDSSLSTAYRYGWLSLSYVDTTAGSDGVKYSLGWQRLAVYGPHGLERQALPGSPSDPGGFYPSDIVIHALKSVSGIVPGDIRTSTGYVLPQAAYKTPTDVHTVINDMASKYLAWHWGVWEPLSPLMDDRPRLDFRPPPTQATAYVSSADCESMGISESFNTVYNEAVVKYQDPSGTSGYVTVSQDVPELDAAGVVRTLELDLGTGSSAAATTFGKFVLALTEKQNRSAGTITVQGDVGLPGGGKKPACLLRPGLDRLLVTDLPFRRSVFDDDRATNTFRIKRVESTIDSAGRISTQMELDSGADLIEVLQARLQAAADRIG